MSAARKLSTQNRIFKIFREINLMAGHKHLAEIAKSHKINVNNLDQHEFLVFVNRKGSACKVLCQGHTVAYYKSPNGKVDSATIRLIPTFFGGAPMELDRNAIRLLDSE